MKKITVSLFAIAAFCSPVLSQVEISENFTSPFNVTAAGWGTLNLSTTIGGIPSWFQGNGQNFPAYNGNPNDYYAAHFNNGGGNNCDISNWLFTPVVNIENGAVFEFATQSADLVQNKPDRLQIRFSTAGANMAIPIGPASVGTYTNLMLDINPLYSLATTSAVSNGTMVNGYPNNWVVYSLTVTGVPAVTQGRFAFRYFVENGGPNGSRSVYVGVDAVKYTRPCGPTVASYTTCASVNTTLTAVGGVGATTYSWNTGATTPYIVVNPASTTVYTLTPINNGIPCPNNVTATITTGPALGVNIVASPANVCIGNSATLTAMSSAPNYSWSNGQTTSQIVVSPTSNTTYSVGAYTGNLPFPSCIGGNTVNINVLPTPTLNYSIVYTNGTVAGCLGDSFTVTTSGAVNYAYIFTFGSTTINPVAVNIGTASTLGAFQFTLGGIGSNGCVSAILATYSVAGTPTVSIASKSVECTNRTLTLTASGADSYVWANTPSLTANPYTVSSGSTTGPKVFVVNGKNAAGCAGSASKSVNISACTGIENIFGEVTDISAFPNPFSNELKVNGFTGRIEVYNALGQQIIKRAVAESETINTADLAKGAYVLKAYGQDGQEVKTIKLLKN